ncbi:hypothetical protein ACIBI3_05625 [Actinomadura luteofluorescens]|uniref:hypothetical protein n=1 Tax=Actinomadura luteofluorescens TaxID=46163 RepID=UPI003485073D
MTQTITFSEPTSTYTVRNAVGWSEGQAGDNAILAVRAHLYYDLRREDWETVTLTATKVAPLVTSTQGDFCMVSPCVEVTHGE